MIVVCAWCQRQMPSKNDDGDDSVISHGICERCAPTVLVELTKRLRPDERTEYDA